MKLRTVGRSLFPPLALIASVVCADAQGAAPYYKGKTVTIVVGSTPGGGYDVYARLLSRYLSKHLPGEPTVIVTNMPGAGSQTAAAYVARVALKDGTFIAAPYATQPLDPILDERSQLNYDPGRMNYLGTAISDQLACLVRPNAPAVAFDDMFKTPIVMGGVSVTSATGYLSILYNNVLGTKFKQVFGYPGGREIIMAIQKGEIDGMCGMNWSSLKSSYADSINKGEIEIAAQENVKGIPDLDKMGIPLTGSYAHDEEQSRILEIIYSQEVYARPYFVAAEVPADRVRMLRRAFMETWRDPDLLKDAATMNLDVGATSGEEVQLLLQKIYSSPPSILQSAREAIKLK